VSVSAFRSRSAFRVPGIDTPRRPGRIRNSPMSDRTGPPRQRNAHTVSAPQDPYEAARIEKLRHIEQLGLDPWGARFDGHVPIQNVLALPADLPEGQRPRVRIAGRIVTRRTGGKLHFLNVLDWSGKPVTRCTEGVEGKHEAVEYQALSSRVQVMI